MREVRTCDFCGADATGLYEPLPASIADGPRMALCSACRDRLASAVDPLLDRIDAGADVSGAGSDSIEAREWPDGPTDRGHEAAPASDDAAGRPTDDAEAAHRAPGGSSGPAEAPSTADPPRSGGPAATDEPAGGNEVSESRDASGRSQRDRARTPHGYRKVMRFLENRPFPMERAEAERLAADAYELDSADVAEAIDHAVQYGRLREVSGELKR